MGQSPLSSTYNKIKDGLPFFQGSKDFTEKKPNITTWCNQPKRVAEKKSILVSVRAPVGAVNIAPTKCCIGRGLAAIKPKDDNYEFIYYLIKYLMKKTKHIFESEGTVFGTLKKTDLYEIKVKIPNSNDERYAIGLFLSLIDKKIEINQKINDHIKIITQLMFKSWFFDFEPFQNGEFEEKRFGMIPKGWNVGTLEEIIINHDSKRIPQSRRERESHKGKYPYYGATKILDYVDDFIFEGIYVLMAEDGSVIDKEGHPVLQYVSGKFWVNNHAHVIQGKNGFSTEYIYLLLRNLNVSNLVTGAVQLKINQGNMNRISVIIPPMKIRKLFSDLIDPLFEQIRNNISETIMLRNIIKKFLPQLFSEKLKIKNPKKFLEEVNN